MCGIVGILCHSSNAANNESNVREMLEKIQHRGPDEFGIYVFGGESNHVALGNARLSVIDIEGGQQPISNEDQSKWIVFNGEIFNYRDLRQTLERKGHLFATDCDTEVVLHAFEEYGEQCVEHFNGQFAFAIWDEHVEQLFLARDRIGIRPLYYTLINGHLVFASEIKAILTHPRVPASLDPAALDQIFTYWSVLSPRTPFSGINSLPPGHWMIADRRGGLQIKEYWSLDFPVSECEQHHDLDEAADELSGLLSDAVRLRLHADVAVGAYLSGGLDSSIIASISRRQRSNRLETFSIAFTDEQYDERGFQKTVADSLGTDHHQISCTSADIGRVFPDVIWHTESPVLRTSPAPMFLLSSLVREKGFKVVLTGEGADEFFAGYNLFKENKVRRFWARQPESTFRPALLARLYGFVQGLPTQDYLQKFFGQSLNDVDDLTYSHQLRWRNTARCKRVFSQELLTSVRDADQQFDGTLRSASKSISFPKDFKNWSPLARAQYLEAKIFLPEYLLSSQGDRMAMANSIEGRYPFLDHRVIEFASRLKPRHKLCGLGEKFILKRWAREFLPAAVWNRPKQPYRAPIHSSFFPAGRPFDWVAELISPKSLKSAGYFNPKAVAMLMTKLERSGSLSETDDMTLVGVISTQLVHKQFVERKDGAVAPLRDKAVRTIVRGSASQRQSRRIKITEI